ncbi:hypothetical protein TetV_491 [Tetraselmis virus 1]|uniref:Uncharacterized protein n=1 Tax=Tetraselmis virus 1 TaxID=2060617 RepID=A0A2P0VNU6_9VIRU|nr:hypothetical protein QJ968_gp563 [Tetraselmis virus 1]AUF82573.1 hypothetical protein TetV_491 [Tetraselmis virus 1]
MLPWYLIFAIGTAVCAIIGITVFFVSKKKDKTQEPKNKLLKSATIRNGRIFVEMVAGAESSKLYSVPQNEDTIDVPDFSGLKENGEYVHGESNGISLRGNNEEGTYDIYAVSVNGITESIKGIELWRMDVGEVGAVKEGGCVRIFGTTNKPLKSVTGKLSKKDDMFKDSEMFNGTVDNNEFELLFGSCEGSVGPIPEGDNLKAVVKIVPGEKFDTIAWTEMILNVE